MAAVRNEADMVNQMARLFTDIPRYNAYIKVVDENGKESGFRKGRIRTSKLDDVMPDAMDAARAAIDENMSGYCTPRVLIQEEIGLRQQRWRRAVGEAPPPPSEAGIRGQPSLAPGSVKKRDEAPAGGERG